MLSFLKSPNGHSVARQEWRQVRLSHPRHVQHVLAHLIRVDGVGSLQGNAPLSQAQREPGSATTPDLYWWDVNGVGAFYAYDGRDLVVVLAGVVANPPTYGSLLQMAQGRV